MRTEAANVPVGPPNMRRRELITVELFDSVAEATEKLSEAELLAFINYAYKLNQLAAAHQRLTYPTRKPF